jgi:outer membrane protein TolC
MTMSCIRSGKIAARSSPQRCDVHSEDCANTKLRQVRLYLSVTILTCLPNLASGQLNVDEQHRISWHSEEKIPQFHRSPGAAPTTVASDDVDLTERLLPLDEAIRIALQNAEVIRVLTGVSATSSGRTIYDAAVATTPIDEAVGRFDPVFSANSDWRKSRTPGTRIAPGDPLAAIIDRTRIGGNDLSAKLARTNRIGGTGAVEFNNNWNYGDVPGAVNPVGRPGLDLSYTQPLLSGAGRPANEAPIVIARLELDRSYFQFNGSMQDLVRDVVSAYWALVEARTQLWARTKQVEQAKAAFDRVEAQFRAKLVDLGDVAQPRVSYANFKANLIVARGNVIQREAALRNLLGLPPEDGTRMVPSTPPTRDRVKFSWPELVETAQRRRPDLIELNLILQADQQRRIQASNVAQPSLNAVAIHRWNGITGRMLNDSKISSGLGDHPSWTLGINFEVPLGLRSARANVRSHELLIARDRANIQQGLHATEHTLATTVRNLDQFYEQFKAFRETREAARLNLQVQFAEERAGRVIFLNVLLAITDWGNAVSSEASSLTQYNTSLATLERETGTILDTHGIVFMEERFAAVGPLGKHFDSECYPRSLRPAENASRYQKSNEAAEEAFDLEDFPRPLRTRSEPVPAAPPRPGPGTKSKEQTPADRKHSSMSLRRLFEKFRSSMP